MVQHLLPSVVLARAHTPSDGVLGGPLGSACQAPADVAMGRGLGLSLTSNSQGPLFLLPQPWPLGRASCPGDSECKLGSEPGEGFTLSFPKTGSQTPSSQWCPRVQQGSDSSLPGPPRAKCSVPDSGSHLAPPGLGTGRAAPWPPATRPAPATPGSSPGSTLMEKSQNDLPTELAAQWVTNSHWLLYEGRNEQI